MSSGMGAPAWGPRALWCMWGAAAQVVCVCSSAMASIGWKIDRPLDLHSLTLSRHPQESGVAVDPYNVLSILLRYGFLPSPALF